MLYSDNKLFSALGLSFIGIFIAYFLLFFSASYTSPKPPEAIYFFIKNPFIFLSTSNSFRIY